MDHTVLEETTDLPLYSNRDNIEPIDVTTNRLIIVNEDPPIIQDQPTRQDVIPALERHILTTDLKGTIEHLRTYNSNKRAKQVTMVTEDLARVSRNEGICNRMRDLVVIEGFVGITRCSHNTHTVDCRRLIQCVLCICTCTI